MLNNMFLISYKEEKYYGIGTLSIPSKEDKITYKYCVDVFSDVKKEVEKQIKELRKELNYNKKYKQQQKSLKPNKMV